MGYSNRISDPAFKKYVRNSNRYALYFSFGLASIALIGFYVAGALGLEGMENPESLWIGMGISAMFIGIALIQIAGRKRSKTWDGVVVDKRAVLKRDKSSSEDGPSDYMDFRIVIRRENGKEITLSHKNDDTVYKYYKIGDRVRHHGGLNSFEKYDKDGDEIIFCAACGTLCKIEDETCIRCSCPLLK